MARASYSSDLDQLRLQTELMAVRVGEALERMTGVLRTGDEALASEAIQADDDVDAMLVSLTERCYDLIRRESPVATDLRFLVSVLRILEELERIGDLSLRVVKQAPDQPLLAAHKTLFGTLDDMAVVAQGLFRTAVDSWSEQNLELACTLVDQSRAMDAHYSALLAEILGLEGRGAVKVAVAAILTGRALERIADHTVIIGERLRYLLTGDTRYLASEVR